MEVASAFSSGFMNGRIHQDSMHLLSHPSLSVLLAVIELPSRLLLTRSQTRKPPHENDAIVLPSAVFRMSLLHLTKFSGNEGLFHPGACRRRSRPFGERPARGVLFSGLNLQDGYLRLVDFGLAAYKKPSKPRLFTFCGAADPSGVLSCGMDGCEAVDGVH
eukprot:2614794-Pleurochrysis_carterae.AAC.1